MATTDISKVAVAPYLERQYVSWLCRLQVFLLGFGANILIAPTTQLLEIAICQQHFRIHEPLGMFDARKCQVKEVQQELALIVGAVGVLSSFAELAVTIPLGCVAVVKGKRFAMALNVAGTICFYTWVLLVCVFTDVLPPRSVLACAVFYLIGGGPHFFSAMLYGVLADITSEDTRATTFYSIQTVVQVTQLFSPAIGSLLMGVGLFVPFMIGLPVLAVCLSLIIFILPDTDASQTLPTLISSSSLSEEERDSRAEEAWEVFQSGEASLKSHASASCSSETQPLLQNTAANGHPCRVSHGSIHSNRCINACPPQTRPQSAQSFTSLLISELSRVVRTFCTARRSFNDMQPNFFRVSMAMMAFFVTSLGRQFLNILLQFVSLRYHWTIAQAGYLFSLKSLATILLFMVILPTTTSYLTSKRGVSPTTINLWVARSSILFLGLGALFIALSPTIGFFIPSLLILCLGFGFGAAMQSLVTSLLTDKAIVPQVYSRISFFESTGTLVGHSLLSVSFAGGIKIGILGLPFFVASTLYFLAAIPVWRVKLPEVMSSPSDDTPHSTLDSEQASREASSMSVSTSGKGKGLARSTEDLKMTAGTSLGASYISSVEPCTVSTPGSSS
ncbi:major facilitator superfamily domain-containing protein [Kalaharituber pfeilii]|nr:major facilitator superfamily domain-containing protein [Kalaharituber pfeilii]